jgi:hypothetical protein
MRLETTDGPKWTPKPRGNPNAAGKNSDHRIVPAVVLMGVKSAIKAAWASRHRIGSDRANCPCHAIPESVDFASGYARRPLISRRLSWREQDQRRAVGCRSRYTRFVMARSAATWPSIWQFSWTATPAPPSVHFAAGKVDSYFAQSRTSSWMTTLPTRCAASSDGK